MKTAKDRIARALCNLMDDDWKQGEMLYLTSADNIMQESGFNKAIDALRIAQRDFTQLIEYGEMGHKERRILINLRAGVRAALRDIDGDKK